MPQECGRPFREVAGQLAGFGELWDFEAASATLQLDLREIDAAELKTMRRTVWNARCILSGGDWRELQHPPHDVSALVEAWGEFRGLRELLDGPEPEPETATSSEALERCRQFMDWRDQVAPESKKGALRLRDTLEALHWGASAAMTIARFSALGRAHGLPSGTRRWARPLELLGFLFRLRALEASFSALAQSYGIVHDGFHPEHLLVPGREQAFVVLQEFRRLAGGKDEGRLLSLSDAIRLSLATPVAQRGIVEQLVMRVESPPKELADACSFNSDFNHVLEAGVLGAKLCVTGLNLSLKCLCDIRNSCIFTHGFQNVDAGVCRFVDRLNEAVASVVFDAACEEERPYSTFHGRPSFEGVVGWMSSELTTARSMLCIHDPGPQARGDVQ